MFRHLAYMQAQLAYPIVHNILSNRSAVGTCAYVRTVHVCIGGGAQGKD